LVLIRLIAAIAEPIVLLRHSLLETLAVARLAF
jgi:hypothetical protein